MTIPTPYIAEYKRPKQRATRPYGFVIKINDRGDYSVHCKYYDSANSYDSGHYDLTYEQAAKLFAEKVQSDLINYPPSCNEKEG